MESFNFDKGTNNRPIAVGIVRNALLFFFYHRSLVSCTGVTLPLEIYDTFSEIHMVSDVLRVQRNEKHHRPCIAFKAPTTLEAGGNFEFP